MSQILPPRGFKYSERTGPLGDPTVTAEQYRTWKLIDALAWDGTPVMGKTQNDLNTLLASMLGISPTRFRHIRASLVNRGLVVVSTSGGMTTLEACETSVDNCEPPVDNSPRSDGVPVDNSLPDDQGNGQKQPQMVRNDQQWSRADGQKQPQMVRNDQQWSKMTTPSLLNTKRRGRRVVTPSSSSSLLRGEVVKNDHNRHDMTTGGDITPQLAQMCHTLQSLGIWRKPALAAAQRALAENLTPDQLTAIAQARIQQADGNLARAAVLLRDEPLAMPQRPLSDTKRRFREELE